MSESEYGYEPSDNGKKGGLFAGLLAALGLGGLRIADSCASVGATAVRSVDNVAIPGSRVGAGVIDDGARLGGRAGGSLDDGAMLGSRAVVIDDAGRPRLMIHEGAAVGEEGHWLETLGEFSVDMGFEVVSYRADTPELPAGPPRERGNGPKIEGPLAVDMDADAWVWLRLATDKPTTAGPWVFSGRVEHDAMFVGDELIGVRELADACRRHGTTCVFVGCASSCAGETEAVYLRESPHDGRPLEPFVANFVAARLVAEPRPMWVAIAGEQVTVLRGKR